MFLGSIYWKPTDEVRVLFPLLLSFDSLFVFLPVMIISPGEKPGHKMQNHVRSFAHRKIRIHVFARTTVRICWRSDAGKISSFIHDIDDPNCWLSEQFWCRFNSVIASLRLSIIRTCSWAPSWTRASASGECCFMEENIWRKVVSLRGSLPSPATPACLFTSWCL